MDIFCEYIVKKNKTATDYLIMAGGFILAFILSFLAIGLGILKILAGVGLLIIVAFWYGAVLLFKSRNIEYEYALTNNELDIDKIMAKKKRKHILTVDFHHIDICAKADDAMYASEFKNTQNITKTYDFTGSCEYDIYFVDFSGENGKTRILFQPTDRMKEGLRLLNPRCIHIS